MVKMIEKLLKLDNNGRQFLFLNKNMEENIIPIEDMATIYLEYTKIDGDKMENLYIGLLAFTNENEISIFLASTFQNRGLGKKIQIIKI